MGKKTLAATAAALARPAGGGGREMVAGENGQVVDLAADLDQRRAAAQQAGALVVVCVAEDRRAAFHARCAALPSPRPHGGGAFVANTHESAHGEMAASMTVRALPPSESCEPKQGESIAPPILDGRIP